MSLDLTLCRCRTLTEIHTGIAEVFEHHRHLLPEDRDSLVLLKPNLNSNMNALTGNTTDLRIISAVIQCLKDRGYTRILIGEGTNSGFYRNNIGVISRLGVDRLAAYYGVGIRDLNYSQSREIEFDRGVRASVAEEVLDAALLINLPKLKTHFENGMTVCLKNLMGCLVGQENKKKVHQNLPENILRINRAVQPHLHIVDALVAMEGLGPTKGTPVRLDTILAGTDPLLLDLACARLAQMDHRKVRTLALAEQQGLLTQDHLNAVDRLDLSTISKPFLPPKAGPLATFIHDPRRQGFFLKIRNTRFFSYLASTHWFGMLLFKTDLRQDIFLQEEMDCAGLGLNHEKCTGCGICRELCPIGLDLPGEIGRHGRCIHCMYCYCACPSQAIDFSGTPGFFREQLNQYDRIIRKLFIND